MIGRIPERFVVRHSKWQPLYRGCFRAIQCRAAALFPVALAACAPALTPLRPTAAPSAVQLCDRATCRDSVQVTYLGVSGFVIRAGESALLTGPSFTHRSLFPIIFGLTIRSDTALVDRRLTDTPLGDVGAILIGHSHYDHLLDVPYIARTKATHARIIGSATMAHILAGDPVLSRGGRVLAVTDSAGTAWTPGHWIYVDGGRFRVMPLASSHARNWWYFTLAPGKARSDYEHLPRSAWGWRMGEAYSYIIDVLAADSTPRFRLFYQDAASQPEHVLLPPLDARDRRDVDVAIICIGNYGKVRSYPELLIAAQHPRWVILGHWENFFKGPYDSVAVVPRTNTDRLAKHLVAAQGDRWTTPMPMTTMWFRY
jgi:Beta-lactamase superfamily domain